MSSKKTPEFSLDWFTAQSDEIRKRSDKVKKRDTKEHKSSPFRGVMFKLPMNAYIRKILIFNEQCLPKHRSTDLDIAVRVRREYRRYGSVLEAWEGLKHESRVSHYRNLFNKGLICPTFPEPPEKLSFRYDNKGKMITSKVSYRSKGVSEEEWVHWNRCRYTALCKHYISQGKYEDCERDWFVSELDPMYQQEYKALLHRAELALERHRQGKLGRGGKKDG